MRFSYERARRHVPFLALNPTLAGGIFVCAHHRSGPRRVRVRDVMVVKTKPVVGMGMGKDKIIPSYSVIRCCDVFRATPVSCAALATAWATAGTTCLLKTLGIMYSSLRDEAGMT